MRWRGLPTRRKSWLCLEPKLPFLEAAWHYARGEAFARRNDAANVRKEAAAIHGVSGELNKDDGSLQAQTMTYIARNVLVGRAAMMEHRPQDAAVAFAQAAELQESDDFSSVSDPPAWYYPIRRDLASALLEQGDAAGARREARGGAQVPSARSRNARPCYRRLRRAPLPGRRGHGQAAQVDHPALQAAAHEPALASGAHTRLDRQADRRLLRSSRSCGCSPIASSTRRSPSTMLGDMFAGRGAHKDWMPISEIDRDMVRAAIAAEDSKFCSHNGFDFEAIEDAMKRNASGGRIRGGSTISQQTAKNAFLWNGGGYARKGVEAWFTFLIEHLWGKRRIMEVYLNIAETGIGTYGVNAGSQRYFGHDASAMSATEAARIAAVLPLPKKRGAIAPKGFTRRYGNTIAARIGVVGRDGLDACVYKGATAPVNKAPPTVTKKTRPLPGEEYETAKPPPPEPTSMTTPTSTSRRRYASRAVELNAADAAAEQCRRSRRTASEPCAERCAASASQQERRPSPDR